MAPKYQENNYNFHICYLSYTQQITLTKISLFNHSDGKEGCVLKPAYA